MPCSPLLKGVSDPLRILRIVSEHHILRYSEPSSTFYPLREKGWVTYESGCWRITDEGYRALSELEEEPEQPMSVEEFFDL
jgi:hypothetical protein